jgi:hypothetical protein
VQLAPKKFHSRSNPRVSPIPSCGCSKTSQRRKKRERLSSVDPISPARPAATSTLYHDALDSFSIVHKSKYQGSKTKDQSFFQRHGQNNY